MGVKTCEQLIRKGLYLAGVTYKATDTRPLDDLKSWLRSVAISWPWPEVEGIERATVPAGEYVIEMGIDGDFAESRYIQRVTFPMLIMYDEQCLPDKILQKAVNKMSVGNEYVPEGVPDRAGYLPDGSGAVQILLNRKPKIDTVIQIAYQYDPAVGYTIEDIPWYMNDDTMEYAVAFKAAEVKDGPTAENTLKLEEALSTKVRNDKIKFGVIESATLKMNRRPDLT